METHSWIQVVLYLRQLQQNEMNGPDHITYSKGGL